MAVIEPYRAPVARRRGGWPRLPAVGSIPWAERAGMAVVVILVLLSLAAPLFAGDPTVATGQPFENPSWRHLLGTDDIGQDIFSRILYGLRASWISAVAVILFGMIIGGAIGLLAGTYGGWVDALLMRLTDAFLALPGPVLAIAVVAALGPSLLHTAIAVAIVWWPWYARLVRGEVRALVVRPHVDAARLAGVGPARLMVRHLLPGAIPPVIVMASLDVQNLVLTLAGLSFLGLGSPPPAPELGAMTARGISYLSGDPLVPLAPAVAIFLLAAAANFAGDGIRDLLDRKP